MEWLQQLCATTLSTPSLGELSKRCVADGVETVGDLLAATLSESDLAALGLTDYVGAPQTKHASFRAVGGGDGGGSHYRYSSSDGAKPSSPLPEATVVAGRLCAVGMGIGVGIGVGMAVGGLVGLKLIRLSGLKMKDTLGFWRGFKRQQA